jgi:hypothetical protein
VLQEFDVNKLKDKTKVIEDAPTETKSSWSIGLYNPFASAKDTQAKHPHGSLRETATKLLD